MTAATLDDKVWAVLTDPAEPGYVVKKGQGWELVVGDKRWPVTATIKDFAEEGLVREWREWLKLTGVGRMAKKPAGEAA